MPMRRPDEPVFTEEDYHRLDQLAAAHLIQKFKEMYSALNIRALRDELVELGLEVSVKDASYWQKADIVEALAEHRALAEMKELA
jgi:hypothetical protein